MAAANTDKFMYMGSPGTATTLSAPGYTVGNTSINVGSTTNWDTTSGVCFSIYETEVVGNETVMVDGTYNEYYGVVSTGTSVTSVTHVTGSGTNRNYTAGPLTVVAILLSSGRENRLVEGILTHANQDGTLKQSAVQSALGITGTTPPDYTLLPNTPSSVVANGNRSYTMTFAGVDLRPTLNPGYRGRSTRTVAAPTQCTSLNGTSQYWSKSSPAGMTFTDDFVAGAWVKLSSYPSGTDAAIITRYNGTSGWELKIDSSGRVLLAGNNGGSGNYSLVTSYQSIPLNKWVHVAAQLDMSTFTATTTISYVMIDGVDVPATVSRAGTNPTALVQAGDLLVGASVSGAVARFFPGKIAQPFVSSAKITQANVRTLYSQGLTSALITANNIISAYSFDNSSNDLNTTNANNLTANGSAAATNADSPFGGQAGGVISSTYDHWIIQSVSYSTDTTVVVQVAEGCTIPTSGGVSAVHYSSARSPIGFPAQKSKWQIFYLSRSNPSQSSAVTGTWYNIGSAQLSVPIGSWSINYAVVLIMTLSSGILDASVTLSTANNSENDLELSGNIYGNSGTQITHNITRNKAIDTSTTTPYYLNTKANSGTAITLYNWGPNGATVISAENAYL